MDIRRSTPCVDFAFDGVTVRATFRPGARVTAADAREHMAVMNEMTGGRPAAVLVDLRLIASQDREARAIYAGEDSQPFTRCCAILVASPISRVIGSFFLGFNKPLYPTRLFTAPAEAEAWLATFPSVERG